MSMSTSNNQQLLIIGALTGVSITLAATLFSRTNNNQRNQHDQPKPHHQNGSSTPNRTTDSTLARGYSIDEAQAHNVKRVQLSAQRTPDEVLRDLQCGNTRFWMGVPQSSVESPFKRHALQNQQHPRVAILGCADSRVPISIVFDQGLGDIFAIRVAGNYLDTSTEGSLEYAVVHLQVKVLIIMGHEGCGAVGAAQLPQSEINKEPTCLCNLLSSIKEGLNEQHLKNICDKKAMDREAVVSNVNKQVVKLKSNVVVKRSIERGELKVVGAFYQQSSGIVDFLEK